MEISQRSQCVRRSEELTPNLKPQLWCLSRLTMPHRPSTWPGAGAHSADSRKLGGCRVFHLVLNLSPCHESQLEVICWCPRWQDCENIAFHKTKDQRIPLFQQNTSFIDCGHIQTEVCVLYGTEQLLASASPAGHAEGVITLRRLWKMSFSDWNLLSQVGVFAVQSQPLSIS